MLNLTGKIALITGASSGIGSAAALMFARKGVDVALGARREERLESIAAQIKEIGRDALVVKTDVTDQDQVNRFVDLTLERFGQIDFLVANSGDYIRKPIPEIDIDTIKQSMTINFYGAVYP
ncbi:MAG: SDR family NAD(P)-dependent oxidoreductase, partial [Aliifodinibius sp.]|nr:SDR family NAD(P)-dependent oxidoreductase [Fodinibius sp.]NIY29033.1 SDR family NAD(P)-dependent oxidoreductase [Fodinibius sp.]